MIKGIFAKSAKYYDAKIKLEYTTAYCFIFILYKTYHFRLCALQNNPKANSYVKIIEIVTRSTCIIPYVKCREIERIS